jgi:hypothetical protein
MIMPRTDTAGIASVESELATLAEVVASEIALDWTPAAGFWQGCREHELRVPKCNECGRVAWYPRVACGHCLSEHFTWEATASSPRLYTWTTVMFQFIEALKEHLPYASGLVDIGIDSPDVNFRLSFILPTSYQLVIGMEMTPVFIDVGQVTVPMFVPTGQP